MQGVVLLLHLKRVTVFTAKVWLHQFCCVQDTNAELREEIRFHEQRRLEEWNAKENQQPGPPSKGKAAASRPAAATSRSNRAQQSPQQASSQTIITSQSNLPHTLLRQGSDVHASVQDAYPASIHDSDEEDDAIYQDGDQAEAGHWQSQGREAWMPAGSQHRDAAAAGPSASLANTDREHSWRSSLQEFPNQCSEHSQPASKQGDYVMNAFQPIDSMGPQETADWAPSSASAARHARQSTATAVDRYQNATVVASHDDFVWQPIRPQTTHQPPPQPPHSGSQAASTGSHSLTNMNTVAGGQMKPSSGAQYARSLRESLDAAARLDRRLQVAEQGHQQQEAIQQGNKPTVQGSVKSASPRQDLHASYAAAQTAEAQSGGAYLQCQAMPLIDMSRPQTAAGTALQGQGQQSRFPAINEDPWAAAWPSHDTGTTPEAGRDTRRLSNRDGISRTYLADQHCSTAHGLRGSQSKSGHDQDAEPAVPSGPEQPYQVGSDCKSAMHESC